VLVLKDWTRELTVPYLMGYCADRFITGDSIKYLHENELRSLAHQAFGSASIRSEFRVPPWHCNTALLIAPAPHREPQ